MPEGLLSMEQAAEKLNLKVPTIRLWTHQRKLASVKLGRRRLIPETEIARVIERGYQAIQDDIAEARVERTQEQTIAKLERAAELINEAVSLLRKTDAH